MQPQLSPALRLVVVSNASHAMFYACDAQGRLRLLNEVTHPQSRAKGRDLVTDAQGRKPSGARAGTMHGAGSGATPVTEPKEVESQRFARELARDVKKLFDGHHAYDSLVLAAPPHFLGLLRGNLDRELDKRIERTLPKDYTQLTVREVEPLLSAELKNG